MRLFLTRRGSFYVVYRPGERALARDPSEGRVTEAIIQGRNAVVIVPVLDDGFSESWVAFSTDSGFITVDANDIPLTEALKVAEGVKCASC